MSIAPANKIIDIASPKVVPGDGKSRLVATVTFDGNRHDVWYEVDDEYAQYLTPERSDAFVIGMLNFAMRNHYDIWCHAPMTSQLLYQIETFLMPSLANNSKVLERISIQADVEVEPIPNAGAVGTGISCGIDSLHAIKTYADPKYPEYKLTHLAIYNVGSFKPGTDQFAWQAEHARRFAVEYGFKLFVVNTNLAEVFHQKHLFANSYTNTSAVYALQKLWKTYFLASTGWDAQWGFCLKDSENDCPSHYDLLSLDVFSTRALKIYCEGGPLTRLEKTRDLIDYPAAQKYLHVCTSDDGPNCGKCRKCLCTLFTLEALDALDKFSDAFNIEEFRKNRLRNLAWLWTSQHSDHAVSILDPVTPIIFGRMSFGEKLALHLYIGYSKLYAIYSKIPVLYPLGRSIANGFRKHPRKQTPSVP